MTTVNEVKAALLDEWFLLEALKATITSPSGTYHDPATGKFTSRPAGAAPAKRDMSKWGQSGGGGKEAREERRGSDWEKGGKKTTATKLDPNTKREVNWSIQDSWDAPLSMSGLPRKKEAAIRKEYRQAQKDWLAQMDPKKLQYMVDNYDYGSDTDYIEHFNKYVAANKDKYRLANSKW